MDTRHPLSRLLTGRSGLRVIGDVHGEAEAFHAQIADARRQNLAVLQVGDIIDRGPDSPRAMQLMLDLLELGDGLFLGGNHEAKLLRYLKGSNVQITKDGLASTLEQLAARPDGNAIVQAFGKAAAAAPLWLHTGRDLFVHGAFAPVMLRHPAGPALGDVKQARIPGWHLALFGETDGRKTPEGLPVRTYGWIDQIPDGMTVHVGHDVVASSISRRQGRGRGTALFLDTGAGKGGPLSSLDISAERLLSALRQQAKGQAAAHGHSRSDDQR